MDKVELRARLEFRKSILTRLREAYLALVDGGAKSYTIGDRQLTRFDISTLRREIEQTEQEIDDLTNLLEGKGGPRKAFAAVPRDW